ncbi:phosphatidate cytidylyltransferase [Mycoplasma capricolum subsp. capricolum]|uniref:phosphatidate cytidylyltransferase n=1 Tax=Mycoplasma capricolum TaxID=2095 RepID=UPI0020BF8963|nr:phosphatidate cytidylyltransferase [Mycoplasma capricolum]MCK8461581.1 phosphatidate cytidylyltransferase [Mycoplasma capricolum subsp. capricolum]
MNTIITKDENSIKQIKKNLKTRLISATILVLLLGFYLAFPILYYFTNNSSFHLLTAYNLISLILSSVVLFLSIRELLISFNIKNLDQKLFLEILTVVLFWIPFSNIESKIPVYNSLNLKEYWYLIIIAIVLYLFLTTLFLMKFCNKNIIQVTKILFVLLIMVFAFKAINFLGFLKTNGVILYGFSSIIWIWATIILTDSFAYLFGIRFGRHKLAPSISPKKSWEGAIGGFFLSTIINLIWVLTIFFVPWTRNFAPFIGMFDLLLNNNVTLMLLVYIFLTILISLFTQFGDLVFSYIKRSIDVKDFSNLIPGHGGILDRLDSFYFVFFIIYIILHISLTFNRI